MDIKKIGIWGGGFIGSFLLLVGVAYFLFPYLNPDEAARVKADKPEVQEASYDPSKYSLEAVDSLNQRISAQQVLIDSLRKADELRDEVVDSLQQELQQSGEAEAVGEIQQVGDTAIQAVEEASKPLLKLDEDALAPIVDLLDEDQLIDLYRKGSGRQREKLLRTLKPEKAARILKKVM